MGNPIRAGMKTSQKTKALAKSYSIGKHTKPLGKKLLCGNQVELNKPTVAKIQAYKYTATVYFATLRRVGGT